MSLNVLVTIQLNAQYEAVKITQFWRKSSRLASVSDINELSSSSERNTLNLYINNVSDVLFVGAGKCGSQHFSWHNSSLIICSWTFESFQCLTLPCNAAKYFAGLGMSCRRRKSFIGTLKRDTWLHGRESKVNKVDINEVDLFTVANIYFGARLKTHTHTPFATSRLNGLMSIGEWEEIWREDLVSASLTSSWSQWTRGEFICEWFRLV